MSTITAAEIKKRGVSALAPALAVDGEAIITVRGKSRYVVMTMQAYLKLRDSELAQAVREAKADYDAGRVSDKSVDSHLKRLDHEI